MREQRKVVTILFADVVGSTALAAQSDPEVVRATMVRYFARIAEVSEAYGGTVEKFVRRRPRSDRHNLLAHSIGGGIMIMFG